MEKMNKFYLLIVAMLLVVAISNDGPSPEECDAIVTGTGKVSVSIFGEPDVLGYQLSAGLVRIDSEREELLEIDNLTIGSTWANSQTIGALPSANYRLSVEVEYCEDTNHDGKCDCEEVKVDWLSSDYFYLADGQEIEFFMVKDRDKFFLIPMDRKTGFLLSAAEGIQPHYENTRGCVSVVGGTVCVDENGDDNCSSDEWQQFAAHK